jgi:hypothetical protein
MLSSRKGQFIALGVAMLMVSTAAMVHVQSPPQGEPPQVDVLAMMSQVRNLSAESAVQP